MKRMEVADLGCLGNSPRITSDEKTTIELRALLLRAQGEAEGKTDWESRANALDSLREFGYEACPYLEVAEAHLVL